MIVVIVGMQKGAKNNGDKFLSDGNQHDENMIRWRQAMVDLGFEVSKYDCHGAQ